MSQKEATKGKWEQINTYKRVKRALDKHFEEHPDDIDLRLFNFDIHTGRPFPRVELQAAANGMTNVNAATSDKGSSSNGPGNGDIAVSSLSTNVVEETNIEEPRATKRLKLDENNARKDSYSPKLASTAPTTTEHGTVSVEKLSIIDKDHENNSTEDDIAIDNDYENSEDRGRSSSERSHNETSFVNVTNLRDQCDDSDDSDDDGDNDIDDDSNNGSDTDSDDSDDSDNNDDDADANKTFSIKHRRRELAAPIIFNAQVSNLFVLLIFLALAIRLRSTYTAIINTFKAYKKTIFDSVLPSTKKSLWKLLSRSDNASITRHWYCQKCKTHIGEGAKATSTCYCQRCGPTKQNKCIAYFIQLDIRSQLIQLFENPRIAECLTYPYTRRKQHVNNMEDIYDGTKYKELCEPGGFLFDRCNFSFSLFTDGVKVSNSSNASAWPVMLMINELPPHLRKKYMILAGIYVDKKPNLQSLLLPTVKELISLYTSGMTWKNPANDNALTMSKFITIVCTADSKARAPLLRMTQGNGIYGCTYCYHKGVQLKRSGVVRVYPYEEISSERRTDTEIRTHMEMAYNTNERVFGVQNYATISLLQGFDLGCGVPVDSMHNVYLGVAKFHTELLLHETSEPWYVGTPRNVTTINKRLMEIRPPSSISRKPRPIEELSQWKASEWRNWIQFYAVRCLHGLVSERILSHLAVLSSAVYILNQNSISTDKVQSAGMMLRMYVKEFQMIFGRQNMRHNIHLLNHLTDSVNEWGPFWTHSAFPYESFNKKIIDKVTSSNSRCLQIATRHLLTRFIESTLCDSSITYETREAVNEILTDGKKNQRHIIGDIVARPKVIECKDIRDRRPPTNEELDALALAGYAHPPPEILTVYRYAIVNGNVKYSSELTKKSKVTRYCDKYIYCENVGYAEIEQIITFRGDNNSAVNGFIIQILTRTKNYNDVEHIQFVKRGTKIFIVCDENTSIVPAILIAQMKRLSVISKLANVWETD